MFIGDDRVRASRINVNPGAIWKFSLDRFSENAQNVFRRKAGKLYQRSEEIVRRESTVVASLNRNP